MTNASPITAPKTTTLRRRLLRSTLRLLMLSLLHPLRVDQRVAHHCAEDHQASPIAALLLLLCLLLRSLPVPATPNTVLDATLVDCFRCAAELDAEPTR